MESYNNRVTKILDTNEWSIKARKILKDLTGDSYYFGCVEIELPTGDIEEPFMMFYIEYFSNHNDIYSTNVSAEGSGIFADTNVSSLKYSNMSRISEICRQIDNAVGSCQVIESCVEISPDRIFNEDWGMQQVHSIDELKVMADKQIWNLEQKADAIFKNVFLLYSAFEYEFTMAQE